ncbi:MAG: SHOCT domain-containing protein [Clostridia bacterium]|nr:SHOCT domain-containing protein [Clostridia bacterium]
MEDIFNDVINEGEKITKVLKPNKFVYIGSYVFMMISIFLCMMAVLVLTALSGPSVPFYAFVMIGGIMLIVTVPIWIFMGISYKNTYFAITNKRLIIRSGVFGIDFKSMDLSDVSAVEPTVSLWEKVAGRHTGSILVGSPTRPILGYGNSRSAYGGGGTFRFANVDEPYEIAKEIKELADKAKGNSSQSVETKRDAIAQIKELDELRKSGAITDKEYEKMKAKLIQDL